MATLNVSTIAGDASLCVQKAEDLGTGSADNVAGKVLALHRHDAIYKAAWDDLNGTLLVKYYICTTVSTSGDNTVIAAPGASNRISVAWFSLVNESASDTTVIVKSGSTDRFRYALPQKGSSVEMSFPAHLPLEMAVNQPLVVNLSAANSIGLNIAYFIRS